MEANKTTPAGAAAVPNELCHVVVQPSTTHALRGVVNQLQVLFSVITGKAEEAVEAKRPPLNLCLLLDRSGSMDSLRKLENAKEAIKKVIQALGEQDIIHLVLYGSCVETLFSNARAGDETKRQALCAQVDSIRTEGCTNMHAGLERAAQVVHEFGQQGHNKRIFLFSDGLVNEGVQDKPTIYRFISQDIHTNKNIKVSAFGLGSDFDEDLMKNISEHGSGSYFFIEGSDAIPSFVNFALRGLFKLVGTDGQLKIRGLNGATVTKVYSHGDLTQPFKMDDLKQQDKRIVVCEMQVVPSAQPSDEVLEWELQYHPAVETASSDTVSIKGTLRIHYTDQQEDVNKGRDNSVLVRVAIKQTGEIDAHVIDLISRGNTKEAIVETEKEIAILKSVVDKDEGGQSNVAQLLKQAESALEDLRKEGSSASNRKKAHHRAYMKKRASISYEQAYLAE